MEQEVNTYGVGKNVNFGVLGLEMEFPSPSPRQVGNVLELCEPLGELGDLGAQVFQPFFFCFF